MSMKIINLLLLLVLAMAANAQNVSSGKDSTAMPNLQDDVFVILTTNTIWRDTCVYGDGIVLYEDNRVVNVVYAWGGITGKVLSAPF